MKTRKILELNEDGAHYICVKKGDAIYTYYVYRLWYDGTKHRQLEKKCETVKEVLSYIYSAVYC